MSPRLSVVIPTRDTRDLTLRCLAALAGAPTGEVQVLLVDDGSADGTLEAVRHRYSAVETIRNEPPGGFTVAANRGLSRAGGEVLLLLNSDTEVDAATLPHLLAAFAAEPRLGAAGASLRDPDGGPQWSAGRTPTRLWLFALATGAPALLAKLPAYRRRRPVEREASRRVDWVTGAAMAIRRQAWMELGPLDERFRFYCQDLDFCLRLRDAGWQVRLVPGFTVVHRGGATIGRQPGAVARSHPGLLWTDLLDWAARRRGLGWARQAHGLMRLGGSLRVRTRSLARPWLPASRRAAWDHDTDAYRLALGALDRWLAGLEGTPGGQARTAV
jgi:GT2 family glycosyltransferase